MMTTFTVRPCKIWTGAKVDGYGQRRWAGGHILVHRLAWREANGPIPDGALVLHRCDIRACHEPTHLFLGDHKDNSDDMIAKGRQRHPGRPGELNPSAVLSDAQVAELRGRYAAGGVTQEQLGHEYGCSRTNVSLIVNERRRRAY